MTSHIDLQRPATRPLVPHSAGDITTNIPSAATHKYGAVQLHEPTSLEPTLISPHVAAPKFRIRRSLQVFFLVAFVLALFYIFAHTSEMGMILGKVSEEVPKHTVVYKADQDQYEIWRLPSAVAAAVYASDVKDGGSMPSDKFTSFAFKELARYIGVFGSPQNHKASSEEAEAIAMTAPVIMSPEKIAMTAPVVMEAESGKKGMSMKFLLPSKYKAIADAPIPDNEHVKIEMVEGGRCEAVFTFSGNFNMPVSEEKAAIFKGMLEKDGVKIIGDWTVQGYNPPFTLPFLKRNEIHFPVDPTPYEAADVSQN